MTCLIHIPLLLDLRASACFLWPTTYAAKRLHELGVQAVHVVLAVVCEDLWKSSLRERQSASREGAEREGDTESKADWRL